MSRSNDLSDLPTHVAAPRPRRRRAFWIIAFFILLAWSIPVIASKTPLRNSLLGLASVKLDGSIRAGGADWGWFSPIVLTDVEVVGKDGALIAKVPRIAGDRPLWQVASNSDQLGSFKLEQPVLNIVATRDSTNLEDLIRPILDEPVSPHARKVQVGVEIVGGQLSLTDKTTGREWRADDLAGTVLLHDVATRVKTTLTGNVQNDGQPGRLSLEFTLPETTGGDADVDATAEASLAAQNFPLAPVVPFMRRVDPQFHLAGQLTSDLALSWHPYRKRPSLTVRGRADAQPFALASSALGADQIKLARLSIPCEASWDGQNVDLRQARIDCDWGRVTMQGRMPLADFTAAGLAQSIALAKAEANGDVNLVPLAAALPQTLRLRQGMKLTSGRVQFSLITQTASGEPTTLGTFEVTQLSATDQGRPWSWDRPLRCELRTRDTRDGLVIDRALIESDFLQVNLTGTPRQIEGNGRFDFRRLANELRKFVNLEGVELAGQGNARFDWRRGDDGNVSLYSTIGVTQFRYASPGIRPWQEEKADVTFTANVQMEKDQLRGVYAAGLTVVAAGDRLNAVLAKPVFDPTRDTLWPIRAEMSGDLALWQSRLRSFINPAGIDLAGSGNARIEALVSRDVFDITRCTAALAPLRVRGGGLNIDEPQADLQLAGKLDLLQGKLDLGATKLTTTSAILTADNVQVTWPATTVSPIDPATGLRPLNTPAAATPFAASGIITYQADIARLHRAFAGPTPPSIWYAGNLSGKVQLQQQAGRTTATGTADIANLQVLETVAAAPSQPNRPGVPATAPAPKIIWNERLVRLTASGEYDRNTDVARLARCELSSEAVSLAAVGQVSSLSGAKVVEMSGRFDYDLERLSRLLRPYIGSNIILAGRGPHDFSVRGPIADLTTLAAPAAQPNVNNQPATVQPATWTRDLSADASFGWSSGTAFGMKIGPGTIRGHMNRGDFTLDPLDIVVNDGRLTFAPQFRLNQTPATIAVGQGPLLRDVKLTPEVCAAALKYVHPFLAGATTVNGKFSVDLGAGVIPIMNPKMANIAGRMKIEQVEISAGPLLTQLNPFLVTAPPRHVPVLSDIEFWVQNGRVFHRGAGITLGKTTIRTSGSIGFDESVDLFAEIPLADLKLGTGPLGNAIRNQTVRIPIRGTLSRFQINAAEAIGQATGGALRDGILDRIFKPPGQ